MAYVNSSLIEKLLHIIEAIRKIKILHHCKSDDLRVDFK
jgi:hypothetical protein|tara:strand:- start:3397 stop:3513 length:117 start_codon:yes stop_codon:yes gene_type:complete